MRRGLRTIAAAAVLLAALLLAACGGSGGDTTGGTAANGGAGAAEGGYAKPVPANGEAEESGEAYVGLGSSPGLGLVLVDARGFVVYSFAADSGGTPRCYGRCAKAWPPLLTQGPPQPSNGASAARLGTASRRDGGTQVTYAGHPLYTYAGDARPGQAKGEGVVAFGAVWHALKGSGAPAG